MSDDDSQAHSRPKLPVQQLTILAVARFAEPIATTSIYPYLPQMVRDLGVEENEVAKWAGLTSAIFSIFQSFAAVPWGKIADRWGRKPSLIIGLLCTMICFIVWGMSTSLPMAITVRAIQGASNGNVGIIRTMVAELVPEKELQPKAFSIMPLVWSLGSVAGPAFGGVFADPARQFPAWFEGVWFFEKFPYALPNFIATFFFLISLASATLFLKETLASKRDQGDWGLAVGKRLSRALFTRHHYHDKRRRSFVDGEATAPLLPNKLRHKQKSGHSPAPRLLEIFTTQTNLIMLAYFFLAFHSVAYDQNVNVFLNYRVMEHTPENTKLPFYFNGGFGLKSGTIGTIFMLYGITCGLVQFILFSPMVTRWGVLNCYKACCFIMPLVYLLTPYTSLFHTPATRMAALGFVLALKAFSIIVAFPAVTILLTNSCTSLRILGTLNGFVTMFSGFGRAIGPATTGYAFSWGAKHGYIVTAYFFLAFVAVLGAIPVFWVVEGDGPAASVDTSDAEDETLVGSSLLIRENAIDDSDDNDDNDDNDESGESQPLLGHGHSVSKSDVIYNGTTGSGRVGYTTN
ncbi:hypothetical protein QQS21_012194 [Conoideocrella luteorostrata]|uniref:Major facilitator superfamily (MFS) profile domain-containing protein n=1 Tax=Conoideocrella luteorostrata TaxID=1105319 RepID=A0AAJ0FML6_9HYPO|nr:hypothetical protein QQS21_012194 [Conoideocrella luteorostrata]